jgi:hypothetical protein
MRRTGILAPRARVELLEGILVDKYRPSARELEVIRNLVEVFAERLNADVVTPEPIHPEDYATFDPTIMVHEWDQLPHSEPYPLHRFSVDDYRGLIRLGILPRSSNHHLVDGVVLSLQPYRASSTEGVVSRLAQLGHGFAVRRRRAVRLGPYSVARPAITLAAPTDRDRRSPPAGNDVLLAIDFAEPKKVTRHVVWPVYARWGIPTAWLIDRDRIAVATDPSRDGFRRIVHVRPGQELALPPPFSAARIAVAELTPSPRPALTP